MPIFISLMTDPTTRELIADLLAALKSWSPTGGGPLEGAEEQYEAALIAKAEAFLAQPEPEEPTDQELLVCMLKAAASVPGGQCTGILDWDKEAIAAARAVLARWGFPAAEPEELSHETAARNAVESCLAQREEVLEAFIAKHGFCPDEAIQVEQRLEDGSTTWRIERRTALAQPEPEGPTDEELNTMLYFEFTTSTGHGERSDPIGFARAVLARWGSQPSTANHSANPTH